MRLVRVTLAIALTLLAAQTAWSEKKPKAQPTIKDIEGRQVEVRTDKPVDAAGAAKAMENYREFLKLDADDPVLRPEAMRRLGDLNLEAGEIERSEQAGVLTAQSSEAITLYTALLESYPTYKQSDAVLYQLARAYESNGQAEEALSLVGLPTDARTTTDGLGAAALKKLELARALATQPKLLLADESLNGLDHGEMEQAADMLDRIRREKGITIVWVEHIMGVLMRVVDRVVVLDHGEVIFVGKPKDAQANARVIEVYLGSEAA